MVFLFRYIFPSVLTILVGRTAVEGMFFFIAKWADPARPIFYFPQTDISEYQFVQVEIVVAHSELCISRIFKFNLADAEFQAKIISNSFSAAPIAAYENLRDDVTRQKRFFVMFHNTTWNASSFCGSFCTPLLCTLRQNFITSAWEQTTGDGAATAWGSYNPIALERQRTILVWNGVETTQCPFEGFVDAAGRVQIILIIWWATWLAVTQEVLNSGTKNWSRKSSTAVIKVQASTCWQHVLSLRLPNVKELRNSETQKESLRNRFEN